MRLFDADAVAAALPYRALVEALRAGFRADVTAPLRHHHTIPAAAGESDATLLLMPAWQAGSAIGVKIVSVFPDNAAKGVASINGAYLLIDGATGLPRAILDGAMLTARRTACASALAADYLARADASHLVMIGTGTLAPNLIAAHAAVRPIRRVSIWGRDPAKAAALADRLAGSPFEVAAVADRAAAIAEADIVSAATLSSDPLVEGAWLPPGCHVDLVGGFTPAMREGDDEAIRRATVFVDTREGATAEAGDIVQPINRGVLSEDGIAADLFDLTRAVHAGRTHDREITLFKSVGTALEDLTAARLTIEGPADA